MTASTLVGVDALDQVETAGLQVGEPHRQVGDRQKHDPVEMNGILIPIIGKAVQHDAVLRHPLDEFVWSGTDRVGRERRRRRRAFGDTIMPARSLSAASSGAKGRDRTNLTV